MKLILDSGDQVSLGSRLRQLVAASTRIDGKFGDSALQQELTFGTSVDSVLPIAYFMCVSEQHVLLAAGADDGGLLAMETEFMAHGNADDRVCFEYCRRGKTGDLDRRWPNGVLDQGREPGLALEWFATRPEAIESRLTKGMVLALRLYTTAAYQSLNNPLRGTGLDGRPHELSSSCPHPLPVAVHLLTEALKRLRAVEAKRPTANQSAVLWRGMRDRTVPSEFLSQGGTEKAPMSTTHNLEVAVNYSTSECSVLLKLVTSNCGERGANLGWVSAFPAEDECLFPPLTRLQPKGTQEVEVPGGSYTIVEVVPSFG